MSAAVDLPSQGVAVDYPILAISLAGAATYFAATILAGKIADRGFPLPDPKHRTGHVDGLRGYLALSVLVYHSIVWLQEARLGGVWASPTVNFFSQLGMGSVELFFMVTGLVFYPQIAAGFTKTSWAAVYVKRVFRLVPLILLSVLLVTIGVALHIGGTVDSSYPGAVARWVTGWSEPALLGYWNSGRLNAYVLWSIWYEWLFYFTILPASALAMDLLSDRLPKVFIPIGLLILGLCSWVLHWPVRPLAYLPMFAAGMIAFEGQRNERLRSILVSPVVTTVTLCGFLLAVNLTPAPDRIPSFLPFFLFFACVACGNSFGGALRTRGAYVLGEISFGIYLLHGLVLYLLFSFGVPHLGWLSAGAMMMIVMPVAALLTVALASLTFVTVERRGMMFGSALARKLTERQSAAAVAVAR